MKRKQEMFDKQEEERKDLNHEKEAEEEAKRLERFNALETGDPPRARARVCVCVCVCVCPSVRLSLCFSLSLSGLRVSNPQASSLALIFINRHSPVSQHVLQQRDQHKQHHRLHAGLFFPR